jgi:hypothetical protein
MRSSVDTSGLGLSEMSLDRSAQLKVTNARLAKLEKMYEELSALEEKARTNEETEEIVQAEKDYNKKKGHTDDKYNRDETRRSMKPVGSTITLKHL